jgi:hypothetical protein
MWARDRGTNAAKKRSQRVQMAAVVVIRRHNHPHPIQQHQVVQETAVDFVETLPPPEEREFDAVLGTLLVG